MTLKDRMMQWLTDSGLFACDTAYALNPKGVTPAYHTSLVELPSLAGRQLRVCAEVTALGELSYGEIMRADIDDTAGVERALKATTRTLMVGMRDEAQRWLDANPEAS